MHRHSHGSCQGTRQETKLIVNSDGIVWDLNSSMGRLAMKTAAQVVQVPHLSSFSFGGKAVAGKGVSPGDIPTNYPSESAYLEDMMAHTQSEFKASIQQGASEADRRQDSGWLPVMCRVKILADKTTKVSFLVDGTPNGEKVNSGHDFKLEPWSRHAIQFEGNKVPALVAVCVPEPTAGQAVIMIASTQGIEEGVPRSWSTSCRTRVRSLGYVGSFIREYCSAADLLSGVRHSPLLGVVAAPRKQRGGPAGSTFSLADINALDTSTVPLNIPQRNAVLNLTGGLDIVVGPPGTGKSTTIWHVIDARVAPEARVLVTCTRNQAVDAVTEKLESFGVLVFGSEARLGEHANKYTMDGRMCRDPELVFWRRMDAAWKLYEREVDNVLWSRIHLANFPGIGRLKEAEQECYKTHSAHTSNPDGDKSLAKKAHRRGIAAGRWARVLEDTLRKGWTTWLDNGSHEYRQPDQQMRALKKYKDLLSTGKVRVSSILKRLEKLTRFRIYTKTRVFVCTIDSTERMVQAMEQGTVEAAIAVGGSAQLTSGKLTLDTAIMDEAGCVLETSVPVLLALGVNNLTLVGDPKQLQPFSLVRDGEGGRDHTRSLMKRALDAGAPKQFLTTQYRMHPRICEVVSKCFYNKKVVTAEQLKLSRKSPQPCKWVHVSGGEVKHKDRGYSNPLEVPMVVQHVRSALRRYGSNADVRVISFYNMQKVDLERMFVRHDDIRHVRISSVDACQGSDADVIIISTVRSGGIGYKLSRFMLDPRRVNVALSRAKEECIIVGDMHTLSSGGGAMWRSVVSHFTS